MFTLKMNARGHFVTADDSTYQVDLSNDADRKLVSNIIKKLLGMEL